MAISMLVGCWFQHFAALKSGGCFFKGDCSIYVHRILLLRFTLASEFLIALLGVEPSASPCYREHAATGRAFCL
jgi:hypothetical protein